MDVAHTHGFPFDPSYGMSEADLLKVAPPPPPVGFEEFWRARYGRALACEPRPKLSKSAAEHSNWKVLDIRFRSTGDFEIIGWLLLPKQGPIRRALVVGHGYGGRDAPDYDIPVDDCALLFPCFRGLSRSARAPISTDPNWHVLHDIDKRDDYIIGGCVDDVWLSVSALLALYPWLKDHIGYSGISFGGGVGAMALAFDPRIARAHLNVPTFGNQPLRLELPSLGSAQGLQTYAKSHPEVIDTLRYYDAATAARFIEQPVLTAVALFDPAVAPPCQFSISNALHKFNEIFILTAGHFDYPEASAEQDLLRERLRRFFGIL